MVEESGPPAPSKIRKDQYTCCLELTDDTLVKVQCMLVGTGFPPSPSCGDILCVRRVAVTESGEWVTVTASSDNPWWLCRREDGLKESSNFPNLALGPTEKSRITELKSWAIQHCKLAPCPLCECEVILFHCTIAVDTDISQRPSKQFKVS